MPQTEPHIAQNESSHANGGSTLHDLFALTDEQILEIEPEAQDAAVARDPWPVEKPNAQTQASTAPASSRLRNEVAGETPNADSQTTVNSPSTDHGARDTEHVLSPPAWLAETMNDPQRGAEARELWTNTQQAQQEATAYREVFPTPQDARALKQVYPGGVNEARSAAERARVLDEIDRAYFGANGNSAEQTSAARAQLAATMLREDPTAFREMVFAGLKALEGASAAPPSRAASPAAENQPQMRDAGLKPGAIQNHHESPATNQRGDRGAASEAHVAVYAAFEKAANEDLERSVGGAIDRTLEQALPATTRADGAGLKGRLTTAIRQDIEKALQGDRQLSEQIAQILASRRFDNESRAQVVRLIGDRAQQLVRGAAKRALNDWTQTTLAAHRARGERADAASARREVAPASLPANSSRETSGQASRLEAGGTRSTPRAVDYRKLSDEQILNL